MTQSISTIGPVDRSGSTVVQIMTPRSWILSGQKSGGSRALATAAVEVQIPPTVTITSDTQVGLFVQAIAIPGQRIEIQNHITLDLSYKDYLYIAPGVQIIGGRSTTDPGPRLFTTTFPLRLFLIGSQYQYNEADNVRISGIRLEGAELGNADGDAEGSVGITVYSSVNVEIDNNEISGWRGAAVEVRDPWDRINLANYDAVRVHNNFIHHNQHYRREGYGVSVHESGYVLIERNVFDYNRHAIASAGTSGNGYYAHSNLVLANGGVNGLPLPYAWHTHIVDVHGTESCWGAELYCGDAGEKFDIRWNTILYTEGTAIKVRGEPSIGAWADGNVFVHSDEWGGYVDDGALVQNDPGHNLYATNNTFGAQLLDMLALSACDFNGDGVHDTFVATGATWWYYSGGLGQWEYLNTSSKRLSDLTLGDVSGDGVCDVTDDDGIVYLGGVVAPPPPPSPLPIVPDVKGDTLADANSALAAAGFIRGTLSYVDDPTCNDLGRITSQSPAAGTHAAAGTPVNLSIGQRPSTPCL